MQIKIDKTKEAESKKSKTSSGPLIESFAYRLSKAKQELRKKQPATDDIVVPYLDLLDRFPLDKPVVKPEKSDVKMGEDIASTAKWQSSASQQHEQAGDEQLKNQMLSRIFSKEVPEPKINIWQPMVPQIVITVPPGTNLDMRQMAQEMLAQLEKLKGNFKEIKFSLMPKELGNVNLTVKMVDGRVSISFQVDADQENFFKKNMQILTQELQGQNIAVGDVSVSVNNNGYGQSRERTSECNWLPSAFSQEKEMTNVIAPALYFGRKNLIDKVI